MSVLRKTTPTNIFNLPISTELIENLRITYKQMNDIVLQKGINDVVLQENQVIVKLASEETLKFSPLFKIKIQIFVKTFSGDVLGNHDPIEVECKDCLCEDLL